MYVDRDAFCTGCGYNLKGLAVHRCPECGARLTHGKIRWPQRPLAWRIHLFDLNGAVVAIAVNVVFVGLAAVAIVGYAAESWFTVQRWHFHRGPESIYGLFVWVQGLALGGWVMAWELSDWASWRWQIVLTAFCWLATVFHAVGVLSLWN